MKKRLLTALGLLCCAAPAGAAEFHPPFRLKVDGAPIRVEAPGYACPCLADFTGKGKPDLLVGQFAGGKIHVFPALGGGTFGKGTWLQAEGSPAEVPGVW